MNDFRPLSPKEQLRRELRRLLRELDPETRAAASLAICEAAARLPAFRAAETVALFAPLPSEPDISPLIEEAWAQGKQVALPRMFRDDEEPRLDWHPISSWEDVTEAGPFGLREPDPRRGGPLDVGELGCVFVPGLAFDSSGLRLGRGGGYYDRFLAYAPAALPRCGLMFACQHIARVPREPHDQALPEIVTEDGLLRF
jgi:5-formyltetrahydrofolate cyclo-ligase